MLAKIESPHAEQTKAVEAGGEVRHPPPRARQAHRPRADRAARRRGHPVPRADAAGRLGHATSRSARSVVTGIGVVEGVECMIVANDPTVKGGAAQPVDAEEGLPRLADRRARTGCRPSTSSSPAAPTCRPRRTSSSRAARSFRNITRAQRGKQPTVALVFGNSTAGGAYIPGMSDYVVMVKEGAKVFLGGPAAGEDGDRRGVRRRVARRRRDARADLRARRLPRRRRARRHPARPRIMRRLNWRKYGAAPAPRYAEPRSTPRSCSASSRPTSRCRSTRARSIARIVDGWQAKVFDEFKPLYGTSLVHRLGAAARLPDRHPRQRAGRAVQRGGAEGGAVHPAGQPDRHAAAVPAQHHRLHGRRGVRAGRHHQARRADGQRGLQLEGPAHLDRHGRRRTAPATTA